MSSGGGPLENYNIQVIVDTEFMFELIFFFVILSSFQMIRKEEIKNKTKVTKLLLFYYTI